MTFGSLDEQYLAAPMLRPGNVPAQPGMRVPPKCLPPLLRPDPGLRGRELPSYLQDERVRVVQCLKGYGVLKRLSEPVPERAREDCPPHRAAPDRRRRAFIKPESSVPDAAQTGCAPRGGS